MVQQHKDKTEEFHFTFIFILYYCMRSNLGMLHTIYKDWQATIDHNKQQWCRPPNLNEDFVWVTGRHVWEKSSQKVASQIHPQYKGS